jgi:hypothetical protein
MTQQRRMTVYDAARKMGISEDAVRMRISARPFRRRTSEKAKNGKFIRGTSRNRPSRKFDAQHKRIATSCRPAEPIGL